MENTMSDKKNEVTNDILIADIMLRLTTMENLLIEKETFSKEEFLGTMEDIAKKVAKVILENSKSTVNVEDFMSKLELSDSEKKDMKN